MKKISSRLNNEVLNQNSGVQIITRFHIYMYSYLATIKEKCKTSTIKISLLFYMFWWRILRAVITSKKQMLLFSCSVVSDSLHPVDCRTLSFPVLHRLPEFVQTRIHRVCDAIQQSRPSSSPSPAINLSQHQGLFQSGVSCLYQMAKVLELQLQHQSFQWVFRVDFL